MSKFKVGDVAYFKGTKGTIDYVEDGYIVFVTDGGAEMDFTDENKLMSVDELDQMQKEATDERSRGMAQRAKTRANPGLTYVEQQGDQKAAKIAIALITKIYEPLALIVKDEPTELDMIRALSEKTGTPVVAFLAFNTDPEMMQQVLRKTMLTVAMDGLSGNNSVVEDLLMANVKKTLGEE